MLLLAAETFTDTAPNSAELALELLGTVAVVFALAGLAFAVMRAMARDRAGDVDPPRTRTVLTCEVPGTHDDAHRLAGLASALRETLTAQAITTADPHPAGEALFLPLEVREEAFVLRLTRSHQKFVITVLDRGPATRGITEATRVPLAGPALAALLDALNRAVRKVPAADAVRWHRRETWAQGVRDPGVHAPIDA